MKKYLIILFASILLYALPAIATKHPRHKKATDQSGKTEAVSGYTDKHGKVHKGYMRHPAGTAPHKTKSPRKKK